MEGAEEKEEEMRWIRKKVEGCTITVIITHRLGFHYCSVFILSLPLYTDVDIRY